MSKAREWNRPRFAIAAALLVSFFTTNSTPAQLGAELIGFDAPSAARAGVDVAIAETVAALVTNPAGLTGIEDEWRIEFSARGAWLRSDYQDALNPTLESDEFLIAPYLGVSWDPEPGDAGKRGDWRIALGLYHLSGFRSRFDIITVDYGGPEGTERSADYLHTGAHIGLAWQMTDEVSFGAAVALTYSTLDASTPLELGVGAFQGQSPIPGSTWGQLMQSLFGVEAVHIEGDLSTDPALGAAVTLGFMWRPSDALSVGVSWRSPGLQQDREGDVTIDISRIFGQPDPVIFPDGFSVNYDAVIEDFTYPQSLAAGVAWRPIEDLRLSLEGRWTEWSATHQRLRLSLTHGDNPGFNAFVGSDNLDVEERVNYKDQLAVGLSADVTIDEHWTVRAGALFATDPVRPDGASPLSPGFARISTGLGVGWRSDGWSVEAAWLHTFPRSVRIGTSLVSTDLDGSRLGVATDSFFITLGLSF